MNWFLFLVNRNLNVFMAGVIHKTPFRVLLFSEVDLTKRKEEVISKRGTKMTLDWVFAGLIHLGPFLRLHF